MMFEPDPSLCVTCGRERPEHTDWCGWVNSAMKEARRGEEAKDWWPWWLEPTYHRGQLGGPARQHAALPLGGTALDRWAEWIVKEVEETEKVQVAEHE